MGHLVNATSLRLGWFRNWTDSWYSEHAYYPEYLFVMLRIRFFLAYLFDTPMLEEQGLFHGHFEIVHQANKLHIDVYYYDGDLENDIEIHREALSLRYNEFKQEHRRQNRLTSMWYQAWRVLIAGYMLVNLQPHSWSSRELRIILAQVYKQDYKGLLSLFQSQKARKKTGPTANKLLLVCLLLSQLRKLTLAKSPKRSLRLNNQIHDLMFVIYQLSYRRRLTGGLEFFLNCNLHLLLSDQPHKLHFYCMGNDTISAEFLSRYISKKLQQNYRIVELIAPLRREINNIRSLTTPTPSLQFSNYERTRNLRKQGYESIRLFLKKAYVHLISNYKTKVRAFYGHTGSRYNQELLELYKTVLPSRTMGSLLSSAGIIKNNTKHQMNGRFFNMAFYVIRNQFNLTCYATSRGVRKGLETLFMAHDHSNVRVPVLLEPFIQVIHTNLYNALNRSLFNRSFASVQLQRLIWAEKHIDYFMFYSYWSRNINLLFIKANINKRTIRQAKRPLPGAIKGFKLTCAGRFSRRERAVKQTTLVNQIPLNTLSANIEYGFFIAPLKNSVVSVKLWLYKSPNSQSFFYKVF